MSENIAKSTKLGREPYQSIVKEATERELAIIAEKSSGRKGKKVATSRSYSTYSVDIVGLKRQLDVFEQIMKV
jgi:hypothetical protein